MNKSYASKIFPLSLIVVTVIAVCIYPYLNKVQATAIPPADGQVDVGIDIAQQRPEIEVVFVLDTTSSMSGLIQAAKENIWSIASTMADAQPAPIIKMGLVAFRDRGLR